MTRIHVRVTPSSSREAIDGFDAEGVLRVRVSAPPADGAANAALAKLLAKSLALPGRDVVLVAGATARQKTFEVALTEHEIRERLERKR